MSEVVSGVASGVCAAQGFSAGVATADIRGDGAANNDVAIVVSERDAWAAGVFTQNLVRAAPVVISERALQQCRPVRAVVINSGNANACTGAQGAVDAVAMTEITAAALELDPRDVLVCSTGVIGRPLPMTKMESGIRAAASALRRDGGPAARAIMTTDTRPKTAQSQFNVDGHLYTVGGMAKGSGMIHPNMATLIAVVTTDAPVAGCEPLTALLRDVCDETLNCVTVDGDTSTNDTLLLLANGAAGGDPITAGTEAFAALRTALYDVCASLAEQVVADAEGATKYFEVTVSGASSAGAARAAARTVAGSPLVKTAIHGNDPNWGRIVAALGRSGAGFELERCCVNIGGVDVFKNGAPVPLDNAAMERLFATSPIAITADLGSGDARGHAWGCDLTAEYVHINADYTT
jgi:glutamate N-acetyltransferase / amino-acid N-acetyltransferase